jgi:hypothetical protein
VPAGLPPLPAAPPASTTPAAAAAVAHTPAAAVVTPAPAAKHQPAAAAAGDPNDPRFAKCGFAKLLGDNGLEYYIKKYEIVMGRKSKVSLLPCSLHRTYHIMCYVTCVLPQTQVDVQHLSATCHAARCGPFHTYITRVITCAAVDGRGRGTGSIYGAQLAPCTPC